MFNIKRVLHLTTILFFTAYVLSCGPRYVREYIGKHKAGQQTEKVTPGELVRESLVKPYIRIWQSWRPTVKYGLALIWKRSGGSGDRNIMRWTQSLTAHHTRF